MTFPEIPPPPADGAAGRTERQSAAAPGTATGTALALLAAVVVAAVACLSAVYTAPESVRVPVAWGSGAAGLVLCVTVAVAAHSVLTARALRTRLAAQDAQAAGREAADGHFAADVVPAVIARLRAGGSAETALAEAPPWPPRRSARCWSPWRPRCTGARACGPPPCPRAPMRRAGSRRWPRAWPPTCARWSTGTPTRTCSATCCTWTTGPRRPGVSPTPSPY